MSSPFPVICLWKKERRVVGVGCRRALDWEWCPKKGNGTKRVKKMALSGAAAQKHFASTEQRYCRRAWMWSGWKDLEEEERHRKVLLLEPLSLPLHFAHCQAHYLISLATLHYDRILSELKANLRRHTALENCDEKKKPNQKISVQKYGQRCCWLLDIIG